MSADDVRQWNGPAVLLPRQRVMLAWGRPAQGARHVSETQYCDRGDWHRYRQELFPRCGSWSRCPADAGEVRSPVFEGTEERLPRRGGDRRGGPTPNDEIRRYKDRRAARLASAAPRA